MPISHVKFFLLLVPVVVEGYTRIRICQRAPRRLWASDTPDEGSGSDETAKPGLWQRITGSEEPYQFGDISRLVDKRIKSSSMSAYIYIPADVSC